MRLILNLALITCLHLQASNRALSESRIIAIAPEDVIKDYKQFLGPNSPIMFTNYDGKHARRDVIEILLLEQFLAGTKYTIQLKPVRTYSRMLEELRHGRADLSANSMWLEDLKSEPDNFGFTSPLIKEGEFEAGLYTNQLNLKKFKNLPLKLNQLTAVSNQNWKPDWRLLNELKLKSLHHTQNWESMFRMVHQGRIDFLLAPLKMNPSTPMTLNAKRLYPVKGIKVHLYGSRHLGISLKSESHMELTEVLNLSIERFRKKKKISQAYEECGFFCAKAKNWQSLTPSIPIKIPGKQNIE